MSHQELDIATLIRKQGYRMTPQRQLILDAVCEVGGHASPESVCERVQQRSTVVNRATVYRTLTFLCEVGLVTSTLGSSGHLEYEIVGPKQHHHLVCQECGVSVELPADRVTPLFETIENEYGFRIAPHTHLSLYGLCAVCHAGPVRPIAKQPYRTL